MVIEKLREKARREALEQRNMDEAKLAKRRRRRKMATPAIPRAIVVHSLFAPLMGVWGAALAGLSVMALSGVTIARLSMFAGLGALGSFAQIIFAAIAAVIAGAFAFMAAKLFKGAVISTAKGGPIATLAARRVKPIDPAAELGSESLDAPIEEMPFAGQSEEEADEEAQEADDEVHVELVEGAEEPAETEPCEAEEEPAAEIADELDLSEFSEIDDLLAEKPHRVTEPDPDGEPKPVASLVPPPAESPAEAPEPAPEARSGIEKLRQTAPKDLSLVQLVERFAAALHDAQAAAPSALVAAANGDTEREKALADALKALSLFTERGFDQPQPEAAATPKRFGSSFGVQATSANTSAAAITQTERELREALSRLQDLQGAA